VREIYSESAGGAIRQAELDQAKSKINSRVVLSSERPRGRLFTVGANWIQRREYRSVRDDLEAVDAITLKDLAAVRKKYPLARWTTFVVGPLAHVSPPN
jgi:predicted Zn-dependent peptidase